MEELLKRGAEARIYKIDDNTVKKIRDKKEYRIDELDNKIRKSRNRREFKILNKLNELKINAPLAYEINEKEFYYTMQYLDGPVLMKCLDIKLLYKAFDIIIKLHNNDIVHKDLTTLNMININEEIYLIDFGLSEISKKIEDKAVDLNLFFLCLKNEHHKYFKEKDNLIKKYLSNVKDADKIILRLEKVELRGRNKS